MVWSFLNYIGYRYLEKETNLCGSMAQSLVYSFYISIIICYLSTSYAINN